MFIVTSLFQFELSYERGDNPEVEVKNISRRIINVSHFAKQLLNIGSHGPLGCSSKEMDLVGEKQNGLISVFTFRCKMCNCTFYINNDCEQDNYLNLNACAVAGTVAIGCGQAQLEEFLSCVNLPILSERTYHNNHQLISKHWETVALGTMKQAAEKEKELAKSEGRVNKDGIAIIDVIADGCWSKRSFKKNYSALSGAAAIIGKQTKQILFLGIKNKYCQICAIAQSNGTDIKDHLCYKNYNGPSTGMESEILVEGFKNSIKEHGLIYGRLISDGDSSTYAKILEARPYADVTVEKVECRNHVLRNFCNKLQALTTDTKYPPKYRKLITKKSVLSMRAVICKCIKKHKYDSAVEMLFEDILLSHHHAFGNHFKCKSYFCNQVGVSSQSINDIFSSALWQKICYLVQGVASHARSLHYDVDSNAVENFHSIVAKFVGGKRINFSKKNSYSTRCFAASVAFNSSKSVSKLYTSINKLGSPQGKLKALEKKRLKKKTLNRGHKKSKNKTYSTMQTKTTNVDYGENCTKPDMDVETFNLLKERFILELSKSDEERNLIQHRTILQSGSSEWMELRRSLLTASNFGKIIKRRQDTSCANTVKALLYKTDIGHVTSVKHGREHEKIALAQLAFEQDIDINPCGLFIDKNIPYLGATPDGISGEDMIIEIKCPISAHSIGIAESINKKKITFWKKNKTGVLEVNKAHDWFYQVQGQLHITQRSKCLFAVWANDKEPLKTELIFKDDVFWNEKMAAKLTTFYMDCILPELVDPRHPRKLKIRDPIYIKEAIENKENKMKSSASVQKTIDQSQLTQSTTDQPQVIFIQPQISKAVVQNADLTLSSCSRYLNFEDL